MGEYKTVHNDDLMQFQCGTSCVDKFEKLNIVGEGSFSQVYKANHIKTGIICAMRKVRLNEEVLPSNSCTRNKNSETAQTSKYCDFVGCSY